MWLEGANVAKRIGVVVGIVLRHGLSLEPEEKKEFSVKGLVGARVYRGWWALGSHCFLMGKC